MAEPLTTGSNVAAIERTLRADVHVSVRGSGERFTDVRAAEARARELAGARERDAAIVRDAAGEFWVYATDELQGAGNARLDELRARVQSTPLPAGATLHAIVASHGTQSGTTEQLHPGRRDPHEGFAEDLRAAGVKGHEVRLMREGGLSVATLRSMTERLRAGRANPAVAQVLHRFEAALNVSEGADPTTRISFDRLATTGMTRPAMGANAAPEDIRNRGRELFRVYRDRTQIALDGIDSQGFNEMVDGWGVTGRVRPGDAAAASLRMNSALFSVTRDLESGAVAPSDFNARTWAEVTPERMMELAERRLRGGAVDLERTIPAMLEDADYQQRPLRMRVADQPVILRADPGFTGVIDSLRPNGASAALLGTGVFRAVRNSAVASATGQTTPQQRLEGDFQVIAAQWRGQGLPPDASQVMLGVSAVTGVSIAATDVATNTTAERLQARVRAGEIAGFRPSHAPGTFYTYRLRTPQELARAARERLDGPDAPRLSRETRALVDAIVGTGANVGVELTRRLDGEATGRRWRQIGGELVTAGLLGAASFGVGAVASLAASSARLGYVGITASNIVAQSVSFTAMNQMVSGELNATDYARDLVMFGPMHLAQRFGSMLSVMARGTGPAAIRAQQVLAQIGGVTAGAGASTAVGVLENRLRGGSTSWEGVRDAFVRNLATASLLHGVNLGLARAYPRLTPEAIARVQPARQAYAEATRVYQQRLEELAVATRTLEEAPQGSQVASIAAEELVARNTAATEANARVVAATQALMAALQQHAQPQIADFDPAVMRALIDAWTPGAVVQPSPHVQINHRLAELRAGQMDVRVEGGVALQEHLGGIARLRATVESQPDTPERRGWLDELNRLETTAQGFLRPAIARSTRAVASFPQALDTLLPRIAAVHQHLDGIGTWTAVDGQPRLASSNDIRSLHAAFQQTSLDNVVHFRALVTRAREEAAWLRGQGQQVDTAAIDARVAQIEAALTGLGQRRMALGRLIEARQDQGELIPGRLHADYANETARGVLWLNPVQRTAFEVTIRDGHLFDASGRPIDTGRAMSAHVGEGAAIFVMGTDGRLYMSPFHQPGRFHHSAFLAGGDVVAAGELVVHDGRIVAISDRSGHYRPDPFMMRQFMIQLRNRGVRLEGVQYASNHWLFTPPRAYDLLGPRSPGLVLGDVPP